MTTTTGNMTIRRLIVLNRKITLKYLIIMIIIIITIIIIVVANVVVEHKRTKIEPDSMTHA